MVAHTHSPPSPRNSYEILTSVVCYSVVVREYVKSSARLEPLERKDGLSKRGFSVKNFIHGLPAAGSLLRRRSTAILVSPSVHVPQCTAVLVETRRAGTDPDVRCWNWTQPYMTGTHILLKIIIISKFYIAYLIDHHLALASVLIRFFLCQ